MMRGMTEGEGLWGENKEEQRQRENGGQGQVYHKKKGGECRFPLHHRRLHGHRVVRAAGMGERMMLWGGGVSIQIHNNTQLQDPLALPLSWSAPSPLAPVFCPAAVAFPRESSAPP